MLIQVTRDYGFIKWQEIIVFLILLPVKVFNMTENSFLSFDITRVAVLISGNALQNKISAKIKIPYIEMTEIISAYICFHDLNPRYTFCHWSFRLHLDWQI